MVANVESTIVMVDDDEDEVFITEWMLKKCGIVNEFVSERKPERLFSTLSEINGFENSGQKIIVLLDINMPKQDGFEMLSLIRKSPQFRDIPVIMLSASDNAVDIANARRLGANGYLVKPFQSDAFFSALANAPQVKHQLVFAA